MFTYCAVRKSNFELGERPARVAVLVEQTALQVPVLRDTWLRIRKQMEGFGHSLMERGEIELANYSK